MCEHHIHLQSGNKPSDTHTDTHTLHTFIVFLIMRGPNLQLQTLMNKLYLSMTLQISNDIPG